MFFPWKCNIKIISGSTSGASLSAVYGSSTTSTISNPDSPGGSAPNNDHNYTLSPGTSSNASSAASTPVNNANRSSDSNTNLNNLDIAQLNNHIGMIFFSCKSNTFCTESWKVDLRIFSVQKITILPVFQKNSPGKKTLWNQINKFFFVKSHFWQFWTFS